MPGLADLVPAQIQASSVGAVTNPNVDTSSLGTLPEFKDFMDAYKQGVITVEDIKKRQIVGNTGYEAERAMNLANKAGAEQMQLDASEVRPLQRELAKTQTVGAQQQTTLANQMNDPDPAISIPAQEAFVKRARQKEAILVFGTATPELNVKQTDVKPAAFDDWVNTEISAFRPGDNSPEANKARAAYENNLRMDGPKGQEYKLYTEEVKNRTRKLEPGTPEYDKELRRVLSDKLSHEKLQEIQFEVWKEFGKAQAKAVAEAPEKTTAAAKDLRTSFNGIKEIDDFAKVNSAYNGILALTDPTVPSTPLRDQGVIYQWMKLLDPSSTVREGEYASVKNAKGIPEKIRNWWNQTVSGEILTPEQRKELREAATPVWQAHVPTTRIKQYTELERSAGLQPGSVVPAEYRAAIESSAPPAAAPASPGPSQLRPTIEQKNAAPTYSSLAEVPVTVQFFKTTENPPRLLVNPNFRP